MLFVEEKYFLTKLKVGILGITRSMPESTSWHKNEIGSLDG